MLSFETARERVLTDVPSLGRDRVALCDAFGRVLARAVHARGPFPPLSASAMDGYALATASFHGEGPLTLKVVGESRMGTEPSSLATDTACRIFTGAPLPIGADAVVMQEEVTREGEHATFLRAPEVGANVRRAGEDLKEGDLALEPGTRLGAFQLALAASLDHPELVVSTRPRVTIVCTGDELRAPGEPVRPGTIAECNAIGLSALAEQAGALVRVAPLVGDDLAATEASIAEGLLGSDLLVTVGGASVGDHDLVRPALERAGAMLEFWKVAIKPGKPVAVGRGGPGGRARILCLPGNPASAMVTFTLFGLPLLRAMQQDKNPLPLTLSARLTAGFTRKPGRLEFLRARLGMKDGSLTVSPLVNQASGAVTSLAWADALAIVPADAAALAEGATVAVMRVSDA
jgi:molybdopterin molybdotransferase